ncbi:tRNA(adenine34) deaminase [Flexibacter flexilis DSM 6793]|uniref:tRNA-specific adenosine deaminase n=2 Tax=Flexibacter flexilis TaxID=998 RepID=A0A1I1FMQ3_9BACT|nr:tRNA(adenine34) deaminase [Flexibacter flexilis DSM 6793]
MEAADIRFMQMAMQQAREAETLGEIPIGAVIVCQSLVIAKAHNQTEMLHDVTAHAEMLALTAAANFLGSKYLKDCDLYVTVEPCPMCAGALYWAQLRKVVYAAPDHKRGFSVLNKALMHPKTQVIGGVMEQEAKMLMTDFFRKKRKN